MLRKLLLAVWLGSVVASGWGLLEWTSVSRERRAVHRETLVAEAAGTETARLAAREADLTRDLRLARVVALADGGLALLIPLAWSARRAMSS